jgi:D-alanyl-D-alanine carboxypeptidase
LSEVRRLVVLVLGLTVAVAPTTAAARPDRTAAAPSLRQLAKHVVAVGAPGAVVFVSDAKGARAGSAGYANVRTKERLGQGHAFRVGSVTKTFVATIVLQLESEGVLGLDDPIERWLPGLVPNGGAITLRHLLSHTSGIYNYTDDPRLLQQMRRNRLTVWAPEALVRLATSHPPLFAPGGGWSYSNTGFILLGLVVEKATGTPLEAQLRRRIFDPLGLMRTSLPAAPTLPAPFSHGYVLEGNGLVATPNGRPADVTVWSPSWAWAAGGVVSTVGDLARFYASLLGGALLPPRQLAEMKTIVLIQGGPDGYGLGLQRLTLRCGTVWGHAGSVPGFSTLAASSEDGSHQAVVMVNATLQTDRQEAAYGAALTSAFCR